MKIIKHLKLALWFMGIHFLTLGCATVSSAVISPATLVHEADGLQTIGYYTGTKSSHLYNEAFKTKAAELCSESGYEIVEKSFSPKTLKAYRDLPSSRFYWVIRCL